MLLPLQLRPDRKINVSEERSTVQRESGVAGIRTHKRRTRGTKSTALTTRLRRKHEKNPSFLTYISNR